MLGYRRAADRNILAQKIPPTSVLIHWTDREKPAALIQCLGENPGVQNRSTYTLFPVLCGLSKCVPFDTNALLWKVKNKYDQNPTILCTFVHRGCFIVLKKKNSNCMGRVPCCFTSLSVSWPMLFIFLTQRCARMDPRSIPHNPKQLETLYRAWSWPGCLATVGHQDLQALRCSFVSEQRTLYG